MEKKMCITTNDYQRLVGLVEFAGLRNKNSEITDRLLKELKVARMLPQDKISNAIVTMNSRVLVKDLSSGRTTELTITYPQDADSRELKVSVFSSIGVALLGCQEGDIASWRVPSGIGRFKVLTVLYQPEAAGHYYL
jgi:regulator of nucleoside diphosphate kinase